MMDFLISTAKCARENAYAPYSNYLVGAALQAADGTVYTGCNVENASFGVTCCAERVAFGKAIADGKNDFLRIAIVGGMRNQHLNKQCMPCGICRQVMREFCKDDFEILVSDGDTIVRYTLAQLLPGAFSNADLEG